MWVGVFVARVRVALDAVGQAQRERLFHIDFRAQFLGSVSRAHLVHRFGVKAAAATRDLILYRALCPDNLARDRRTKAYRRADAFLPLFTHEPGRTLTALAEGLGDDAAGTIGPHVRTEHPLRLNQPDIAIIAALCRAIAMQQALEVRYLSLTSGARTRVIVPFALVDTGTRWHVRAYDHERGRYLDFVLTRLLAAEPAGAVPHHAAMREADAQWMRLVELEIVPHPGLAHPEAVRHDYGMEDGVLRFALRAALVGYALLHFRVDTTPDHSLQPDQYHLWLRNRATLYGVQNLAIAPGLEGVAAAG